MKHLLVAVGGQPLPLGAWRNLPGRAPRLAVDETSVSSAVDETRGGAPPHATPGRTYSPRARTLGTLAWVPIAQASE